MSSNYQRQYQKEHENLISEVADFKRLTKKFTSTIGILNDTINKLNITSEKKDGEIKKLILEIGRLKKQ